MRRSTYTKLDPRYVERTTMRTLPETCLYCAYIGRPSSTVDNCSTCCKKAFNKTRSK